MRASSIFRNADPPDLSKRRVRISARKAARLAKIEYQEQPPLLTVDDALEAEATIVFFRLGCGVGHSCGCVLRDPNGRSTRTTAANRCDCNYTAPQMLKPRLIRGLGLCKSKAELKLAS